MAEINLLKNQVEEIKEKQAYKVMNKLGVGLLILVVVAYIFFFFAAKSYDSQAQTIAQQQAALQMQIEQEKEYPGVIAHQDKLKNLQILLDKHLSWGDLIQKFGNATLKTATYTKFIATSDGGATITGIVPDFQSLDKLIKGYQLNQFQYIKDVKLINIGLSDQQKNALNFTIQVTFNKDLLQPGVAQAVTNLQLPLQIPAAGGTATPAAPTAPTTPSSPTTPQTPPTPTQPAGGTQ